MANRFSSGRNTPDTNRSYVICRKSSGYFFFCFVLVMLLLFFIPMLDIMFFFCLSFIMQFFSFSIFPVLGSFFFPVYLYFFIV